MSENTTDKDEQQAPERFWIAPQKNGRFTDTFRVSQYSAFDGATEYIRADLARSRASLAAVAGESDYDYAVRLARHLMTNRFPVEGWQPLPTLSGVLSQIDNMIAGLTKPKLTMRDLALRHTEQGLPAAASSPLPAEPEGERERLTGVTVGSSRHPHFTHADHERMKATLDALPDNPTEEEAEAVLQVCGTSGKEVVNEFIERLLRERSEMQAELERLRTVTPPETPVVAREIAKEILGALWMVHQLKNSPTPQREDEVTAIITRHLGATPAALCRASLRCRSGEGRPKVELWFSELKDAQAVHKWLMNTRDAAATPSPSETAVGGEAQITAMWEALKREACKVPDEAQQIVFLGEQKFRKAMAPFVAPVPAAGDDEGDRTLFTTRVTLLNLQGRCDHDVVLTASCWQCAAALRSGEGS